jgi:hypothetical protein
VSSLAWHAGRAAAMSPSEMMWRASRVSYKLAHSLGPRERPGSGPPATPEHGWDTPSRGMDRGARAHPMEALTRPEWVGPHAPQEDEP